MRCHGAGQDNLHCLKKGMSVQECSVKGGEMPAKDGPTWCKMGMGIESEVGRTHGSRTSIMPNMATGINQQEL